jgi:hypothetical protein
MDTGGNAGGGGPQTPLISLDRQSNCPFQGEVEEKVWIGQAIFVA